MALRMFPNNKQRPSLPRVSISTSGIINFNSGSVKYFGLDQYKCCILFYDDNEKIVVVELSNDENNPTTVTLRNKSSGAEITSKSFFSYFGIVLSQRILCEIEPGEEPGRLVINLKNAVTGKKRTFLKHQKDEEKITNENLN